MKTKLTAGAELDLLTQDELRATIKEEIAGYLRPPEKVRGFAGVALTAGGATTHTEFYKPPAGMEFALTRFVVDFDATYTPGNPYTNAAGYLTIERDNEMQDFVGFTLGLPAVYTENLSKAIVWRDLEPCTFSVVSGPASANLLIRFQGYLYPQSVLFA